MRGSGVFWGLVLLLVGGLLLLANLGIVTFNFWQILWPAFLILLGLWILLGVSRGWHRVEAEHVAVPLAGAEQARIVINHGAGAARLRGVTEPGQLMIGDFGGGLDYRSWREGTVQHLKMEMSGDGFPGVFVFPWTSGLGWQFALSREVPISLKLDGGAGTVDLDMLDLRVTDLTIDGGVGTVTLTMPARAGHTRARVEGGVGTVLIRIPEGVAAQIEVEGGLGSINVNRNRFTQVGDHAYRSPGYDTAENKLDLFVEGGVGTVTVN